MRALAVAFVVSMLVAGSPASAQVLDLSTIKCKDFVSSSQEKIGIIHAWMNAYYMDEDAPPLLDFGKLTRDGEKLGAHCGANPEMGLITAADALFDK